MSEKSTQKMDNPNQIQNLHIPKTHAEQKSGFERIVQHYLESNPFMPNAGKISELEIRFGTNPRISKPITKIEYENVVKQLYACGFVPETDDGIHMLRIQNEYTCSRTGKKKISNIRAEIPGLDLIQEYCRTNSLQRLIDMPSTIFNKIKFTQKMGATTRTGEMIHKHDVEDFNFRVSYQTEQDFHAQYPLVRNIIDKWNDSLKIFRSMNRVRFVHPEFPIFADLTIVKSSKKTNKVVVPKYTIQEADVFNSVEQYEVELEVDNSRVGHGSNYTTLDSLMIALRKCIRIILSGIQGSKFPISYKERDGILQSYMQVLHGQRDDETKPDVKRQVTSSNFIGPSSVTLQMEHIIDNTNTNLLSANIRNGYTVTDKADGDRALMYISSDGRIYLIDTNMNVKFTGTKTVEKTLFDSLVDGEHIKYDKTGKFINLYAAFDIYYVHEKSVREYPFISTTSVETTTKHTTEYRLPLLHQFIDLLNPVSILDGPGTGEVKPNRNNYPCEFRVQCKAFYYDSEKNTIFDGCSKILSNAKDGIFEYNTDGLIFTPSNLAVGASSVGGKTGPKTKFTWEYSFKWKPAEFNTIDFLVTIKKNKMGKDEINHIFQEGKNLLGTQSVSQYKTLVLRCGFSERTDGFLNPCQSILDDMDVKVNTDDENEYKPVPFYPTDPYDKNAHLCNIMLQDINGRLLMQTEEGEYFDENMIVEFKYVMTNRDGWRWVPLRVRYDKTAELLSGIKKNYGNAYRVANNNWHSIHNPITEDMISTGQNIPGQIDEVYYSKTTDETSTQALRNFHNLYIKSKLIEAVSTRDDTLIDYAVGKGGDLAKWIYSNLKFVFGIDISPDNIHNQLDGACARYLKAKKKYSRVPSALFVRGNSGMNIRTGEAFYSEKDKQITNAVFGTGAKDATILGKGVYKNYGMAEAGFHISSCQFAMHYFFEDKRSLHQFLRNLTECTRVNGYFIGTCYDGQTVFDILRNKKKEERLSIFKGDSKIFELTRMYEPTGFPDDELSLGYAIDVYQESINKVFREYLVNFTYFIRLMEDYGFSLITKDEARHMNLPDSTGLFSELFGQMSREIKTRPHTKANYKDAMNMSPEEKQISFMNRYFVFKKTRSVDAKKMGEIITKQTDIVDVNGVENIKNMEASGDVTTGDVTTGDVTTGDVTTGDVTTGDVTTGDAEPSVTTKATIKKTRKKVQLTNFTPVQDDTSQDKVVQTIKKPKLNIVRNGN